MIKEIKYKGYTATPSDYECADGELAMSLNAVYEDGALRPIMQPAEIMLSPDAEVKCVHELATQTNYIVITGNNELKWRLLSGESNSTLMKSFGGIAIYQITPVGNTLVVTTSDGIYYFLWKEGEYISLGNELPELNASPYIVTNLMNPTSFALTFGINEMAEANTTISGDEYVGVDVCKNLHEGATTSYTLYGTVRQNVYDRVFAILNHYSTILKRRGFFIEPFYVRFAFRMFDGSHVRHTVPVLLVPTTSGKPLMGVHIKDGGSAMFNPIYSVSQLFANITLPLDIDLWHDIITDIDVFVTEPLVDYTDDVDSLVSLSKLSYENDENKPKCMTYLQNNNYKYVWQDIPSMIEKLNQARFYIIPSGKARFTDGVYRANLTNAYNAHRGALIAFDTSVYKMQDKVYNTMGQEVADASDYNLENFPNYQNYTFFQLTEGIASPYGVNFKLKNESLNVELSSYVIHYDGNIDAKYFIDTKRTDGRDFNDVLVGYNTFYKISELNIHKISGGLYSNMYYGAIPIKEGVLLNLTTFQTLSDLGQCHNNTVAEYAFDYNNRLNVILKKERVRNACTSLRKQNPFFHMEGSYEEILMSCVEIFENGQKVFVEIPLDGSVYMKDLLSFVFPHNNAKNLILYNFKSDEGLYKRSIPLKQHPSMNLSYAFNMFAPLDFVSSEVIENDDFVIPSADTIEYGNIIRLSDVNNPFRFSEEYSVSLPVSEIYALSTAAKALSQGQFGQYPLYAFTSDGIWALEVSSTGTYSARQPISRDVAVNPDSITQIDSAVLFATDRGIMLISGSDVMCISDIINSPDVFDIESLPRIDVLVDMLPKRRIVNPSIPEVPLNPDNPPVSFSTRGQEGDYFEMSYSKEDLKQIPFLDFVKNSRMIYDYTHQRIIVYNPDKLYAYVYSLKSQRWGMMLANIKNNIDSYPGALAMTSNNRVVDFSKVSESEQMPVVFVITRPFNMDVPDVHKTIDTIIQRGNTINKEFNQVLYGSNDLNNWFVVWSSKDIYMRGFRGTPYKYYRLAFVKVMDKSESLQGLSAQYESRWTNRLR